MKYLLTLFCVMSITQNWALDSNLKVKFGGDAYVRGYAKRNVSSKDQGFAQLLRLKVDLQTSDKIKISTRTVLSGDQWNGDEPNNKVYGNSDNSSLNGGNTLRLDYGYIEVPLAKGWNFRAGRQEASFSDCFNACDDRRDRLMLYKYDGRYLYALLFDKRNEGAFTDEGDDADMYGFAMFYFGKVHEWAFVHGYLQNDDNSYVLNKVHNFSPYYKYHGEKLELFAVMNWAGLGSQSSWFHGHHNAWALRGEYRFNKNWEIGAQAIVSTDGGIIASGYDSYSFAVNNDPQYNSSNTLLVSLGGLGTLTGDDKDDENFFVTRLRHFWGDVTSSVTVGKAKEYINPTENDLMVYDFQVHYQYSKNLLMKAGFAMIRDDRNEEASLFQIETKF